MSIGSGIVLELEPVSCAVCGTDSASARTVFEGYDIEFRTCDNAFSFVECPKCAHWYLPMRPKEEDIDKIYANYLTQNTGSAYHPWQLSHQIQVTQHRHRFGLLETQAIALRFAARTRRTR